MGDKLKRGKKIISFKYNNSAIGVCLGWNFSFKKTYFPQPDEDSDVDNAQLLMHKGTTVSAQMIHGAGADSDDGHSIDIAERLGDGTARNIPLGNFVVEGLDGSHSEGGVTVFSKSWISVGDCVQPNIP